MKPWELACTALEGGEDPVLVAVVEHRGSVPGKTGALMIVSSESVAGTIGGGLVEHSWINRARKLTSASLDEFCHDGSSGDSLCSGSQIIASRKLGNEDFEVLKRLRRLEERGGFGILEFGPTHLHLEEGITGEGCVLRDGEEWSCRNPLGSPDEIYIAGGGHVSLALSRIMATLPFHIEVFDTRPDLPTMLENQWAHGGHVLSWKEFPSMIREGNHAWVIIMTHGHRDDAEVLRNLIGVNLRYLGLMGSVAKVARLFEDLKGEGIPAEELNRVWAPIGLPIGSHTPEEIAVSIAAEIIQIRNGSTELKPL